jgi:electron-transferring-flavoprotein dehydrogenase
VVIRDRGVCQRCGTQVCVEVCSGQALTPGTDGAPAFDREKCVHCGACQWSCVAVDGEGTGNVELRAGAGGLHSSEN